MDKKVFKMYEAPAVEIVDVELEGFLCASTVDDVDPGNDENID